MGGGSKCDSYFAKGWSSYGAVQTSAARGSELSKPSSDTMMMFPIPPTVHAPNLPSS